MNRRSFLTRLPQPLSCAAFALALSVPCAALAAEPEPAPPVPETQTLASEPTPPSTPAAAPGATPEATEPNEATPSSDKPNEGPPSSDKPNETSKPETSHTHDQTPSEQTPRAPADAEQSPLAPRDTADLLAHLHFQTGVFNPLRLGLGPVELEVHPLVALVAPHVDVRFPLLKPGTPGGLRATGLVGLAVPTGAFRLAKPFGVRGDLVPSCKVRDAEPERGDSCDEPPWVIVGKLGAMASVGVDVRGGREWGVLTAKAEVAKGLNVSGDDVLPLDAWAPVSVKLAPALGQFRAELSLAYDQAIVDDLRLRLEFSAYHVGRDDGLSPWSTSLHLAADLATSRHTRLTLGVIWWTADTHERVIDLDAEGFAHAHYVRSHEFWPTFDFLWRY